MPGAKVSCGLGTSTSTCMVRVSVATAPLSRATVADSVCPVEGTKT